jgi:CRP-like cAMP-binding protein/CheY-like chemotaxis protein
MKENTRARILVVEDESIVAMDIADCLGSLGYEVVGTTDHGEDAINKATTLKPDLVIMDIMLKGAMDGISAAETISTRLQIPVIFLTAHSDESTLQRAKVTAPYGYILKPFDAEDLRTSVEIALYRASHRAGSPDAAREHHEEPLAAELLTPDVMGRLKFLEEVSVFRGLPTGALHKIAASASVREIGAGGFVFHAGGALSEIGIVASGRIAVVRSSASGKELIVDLVGPSEIIGLQSLSDSVDQSISARAQIDSRVLTIPLTHARTLLAEHPENYPKVLHELGIRLRKSQELASSLAHAKVETRIASTLLALLPEFGKGGGANGHPRIFLTRKELAELTGTTPETAIRTTKHLERQGILDLTRPGIIKILKQDDLRALTD